MNHEVKIKIKKELANELQELLDMEVVNFHKLKIAKDSTLETFTATFENGYQTDIKVCSGQTCCFIDPVLFTPEGYEACIADPDSQLLGKYSFESDGDEYKVILEKESVRITRLL